MTCTKKRFRTKLDAKIVVARATMKSNRGNENRNEIRVYRCSDCKAWHVTSQARA